jgi:predicted permease
VGATSRLPLTGETWIANLHDPDSSRPEQDEPLANFRFVTPDYWRAMGIPLVRGRFFRDNEWSQTVAIVSEGAARFLWPGQEPIGRHVRGLGGSGPAFEVVGVVGEVPAGSLDQNRPTMVYTPYSFESPVGVSLVLRSAGDPASAIRAARSILAQIDPEMALPPARTMQQILDASVESRRFEMRLAMAFALAALLLAALGIYGVISFAVARRRPEIGIRIAMGARSGQVVAMVLRQGMRPVLPGLVAGVAGAISSSRLLAGELYQVPPRDPRAILCVAAVMLVTALGACWIPARRGASTDPIAALRAD